MLGCVYITYYYYLYNANIYFSHIYVGVEESGCMPVVVDELVTQCTSPT